jgi:tRNA A-37 threonylcarbamoyl transferase component Bud32
MQCPSCQTEVDASQRFCPKCGTLVGSEVSAPDPLLGTTIGGKYKIVRLLGEGGMGSVYEGEQLLGTKVRRIAIKTLHAHLSKDPKIIARFQREVGTVAELEHPNTIQVYDFGSTSDGQLFIAMEFVQGQNIADILEKEGPMSAARAQGIFEQIAGSLGEAHQHGIVHRDLKPDNIVLTERAGKKDFVKVLDFGIAKHSGEDDKNEPKLTQAGMVLGTPPYMSPEQFTGKAVDARSDIYSLGIVVYEMLCGKLPFKADTAWEWASQHMTVAPIAIESTERGAALPERIRAAISKALAKSPDDRWPTVGAFYEAFAKGTAASAVTTGPREIAPKGGTAMMGAPPAADPFATTANPYARNDAENAPRAKTEIGTPIDAAGFGGAPPAPFNAPPNNPYRPPPTPMGAGGGYGPPPVMAGTPYGAPGAIPLAPIRTKSGGGGGKGLLIAVALLLIAGAGAAAFFALKPASRAAGADLGPPTASTPDTSSTPAATADTATPSASEDPLAPLAGGNTKPKPTHEPTATPTHEPTAPRPTATPTTPTAAPTPTPTTPPTNPGGRPAPPTAPMVNGQPAACAAAATMKQLGQLAQYNRLASACRAQGGTPP